jgi:hypothetical protein
MGLILWVKVLKFTDMLIKEPIQKALGLKDSGIMVGRGELYDLWVWDIQAQISPVLQQRLWECLGNGKPWPHDYIALKTSILSGGSSILSKTRLITQEAFRYVEPDILRMVFIQDQHEMCKEFGDKKIWQSWDTFEFSDLFK